MCAGPICARAPDAPLVSALRGSQLRGIVASGEAALNFVRTAIVATVVASAPAMAAETADQVAIRASTADWTKAYEGRDLDGLMKLYEPDATVALNGQPVMRGVGAVRAYFARAFTADVGKFELNIEDIRVHGDVAHLVSLFRLTIPVAGKPPAVAVGRSLLVYKRAPSGWRILADIDNVTPDAEAWAKPLP